MEPLDPDVPGAGMLAPGLGIPAGGLDAVGVDAVEGMPVDADELPCGPVWPGVDGEPEAVDDVLELGLLDGDELLLELLDDDELEDEDEGELGEEVLGDDALGELLLWLWDCCIVLHALSASRVPMANITAHRLSISFIAASVFSPLGVPIFSNNS